MTKERYNTQQGDKTYIHTTLASDEIPVIGADGIQITEDSSINPFTDTQRCDGNITESPLAHLSHISRTSLPIPNPSARSSISLPQEPPADVTPTFTDETDYPISTDHPHKTCDVFGPIPPLSTSVCNPSASTSFAEDVQKLTR